jgi:hypothetical protein
MFAKFVRAVAAMTLTAALAGCGGSPPPGPPLAEPQPTHGKVTFPDKTELRGGIVYFTPLELDGGMSGWRYETASVVDAHGNYTLGYNNDKSGTAAGEYKVTIQPLDYNELKNSNSKRIPEKYRSQRSTPLTKTVVNGDNTFDFVLE